MKSFGIESIKTSIEHSVWSTSSGPTKKLQSAFNMADHVVLIFSVNESRNFQGFALM
jgi:cleavage and polyadenylation specificity factor subunit 4